MVTEITRAAFVAMASRGEVTSEQAMLMNLHGNVVIGGMHYVLAGEPEPEPQPKPELNLQERTQLLPNPVEPVEEEEEKAK